MPTVKDIEYLTHTGYVPTTNLSGRDYRVGFSVLNYTPETITVIVDDNLTLSFRIVPFSAKSVPITIRKHIKVVFPENSKLSEGEHFEIALFGEEEARAVLEKIGNDIIDEYLHILKEYKRRTYG